tara:strand:- start:1697 stop:2368 length:672 start_codon:yes stop_codon:yes gene_type:complete
MHLKKNKKILLYLFLFLLFGTFNNKNFNNFEIPKIEKIKVSGMSYQENFEILSSLENFKIYSLFFLKKNDIEELLYKYNYVEEFFIFKEYPSSLNVKLKKTKFLAYVEKDNKIFYLGSNGKLIKTQSHNNQLPYIYGNLNVEEFFNLKKTIVKSKLDFDEIKNLFFFPSERWDIQTHSGVLIKLPKLKLKESLDLYIDLRKKEEFTNIKIIDLRQSGQVIING